MISLTYIWAVAFALLAGLALIAWFLLRKPAEKVPVVKKVAETNTKARPDPFDHTNRFLKECTGVEYFDGAAAMVLHILVQPCTDAQLKKEVIDQTDVGLVIILAFIERRALLKSRGNL